MSIKSSNKLSKSNKKAAQQITMLLLQIVGLIIISIFASIYLSYSGESAEKTTTVMDKAHDNAKTNLDIDHVIIKGNNDSEIEELSIVTKLPEGSSPVKIEDLVINIRQSNVSSTLKARNGTYERDKQEGYYTE